MAFSKALARARSGASAARRHAGSLFGKVRPQVEAGGAGFGAFYLNDYARKHLEFVNTTTWGGPALMFGGAYLAGKKPALHNASKGLAGAAGYLLALNMELQKYADGKRTETPVLILKPSNQQQAPAGATSSTQGIQYPDTGLPGVDPFNEPPPVDTGWSDDTGAVAELRDTGAVAEIAGPDDYDVSDALNLGGGFDNRMAY